MMWAFAIRRKITAAALLLAVLLVVLLTNLSERSNSNKINSAVASLYQDRLVVGGYIFHYSQAMKNIENTIESSELSDGRKREAMKVQLDDVSHVNDLYLKTRLTSDEKAYFNEFVRLADHLEEQVGHNHLNELLPITQQANNVLEALADIQVREGKIEMDKAASASSFSGMLSELELALLIILAVMIQILVFTSKGLGQIMPKQVNLN